MSCDILSGKSFSDLDIHSIVRGGLAACGFSEMTKVQADTIPALLAGSNLAGAARTGSGKTLAFLVPALHALCSSPAGAAGAGPAEVLVISPLRELAIQIFNVANKVCDGGGATLSRCVVTGGSDRRAEAERLRKGARLVVATPGRLLDHLHGTAGFDVSQVKLVILDEVDACLAQGLRDDLVGILKVLAGCAKGRVPQIALFSATQTEESNVTASALFAEAGFPISDLQYVQSGAANDEDDQYSLDGPPPAIRQSYVVCDPADRFYILMKFITHFALPRPKRNYPGAKILVFFGTCACADFFSTLMNSVLAKELSAAGAVEGAATRVFCLHGGMSQKARTAAFTAFSATKTGVLFSTNVAARGLDIAGIDWVVQMDPPADPRDYVHRVGRACRGVDGKEAQALLLLNTAVGGAKEEREAAYLPELARLGAKLAEFSVDCSKVPLINDHLCQVVGTSPTLRRSAESAYIAYLRGYETHSRHDIFDIHALDIAGLARSFGLDAPPNYQFAATRSRRAPQKREAPGRRAGAKSNLPFSAANPSGKREAGDKRQFSR